MKLVMLIAAVFVVVADAQTCTSPDGVTYEEFGAVGDGKADDQKAIVAAHAAANKRKLPVRAGDGKTYYIGGGAKVAVIKTDVDFGTAKFVIDDRNLENVKAPVFRVDPSPTSPCARTHLPSSRSRTPPTASSSSTPAPTWPGARQRRLAATTSSSTSTLWGRWGQSSWGSGW